VLSATRLLNKKDKRLLSIMTTHLERSEGCFAVTAITESSGDTETRIYLEGWLDISKEELAGIHP
jgi:hypothetical protein